MANSPGQFVEALITNVRELASHDGYKAIASVLDEVPKLKAQIETKDVEMNRLRQETTSLETRHKNSAQVNLEMYCMQRNKLEDEKAQLSKEISTLRQSIQQRDAAAEKNHRAQDALKKQVDGAKKALDDEKKNVAFANTAITKLQEDLKGKDSRIDKLKEGLQNEKTEVSKVKNQSQELCKERDSLQQELRSSRTRLHDIDGFIVELHGEEDEAVWMNRLEKVWASAHRLVESLFEQDLAPECLRDTSAWKDLRELHLVIPLPASNSAAAKQMRIAAVLAFLARRINRQLFQPTYLLIEEDEMRRLLVNLAIANSKKESFCRSVLLSLFPEIRASNAEKAVERVIREVSWSVERLVSRAQYERFRSGLNEVVHEAREAWQLVQCSRGKFEALFEPHHYDEIEWQPLSFHNRGASAGKEKTMRAPEASEILLVIFPRIHIVEDNEPEPVTLGVALMKSQSAAAIEEMERKQPSSPTAGRPGPSSRAIRSRTKSMSMQSGSGFLPQPAAQPR